MWSSLVCVGLFSAAVCGAADESGPLITTGDHSEAELGRGKDPMQELLHWAIQHSDPEKLAGLMLKYKEQNLTLKDVYGEDMLEAMFVNEAGVMQSSIDTIADFHNNEHSNEDLEDALVRLRDLVEQVDNALNLHVLGGLAPLLDLCVAVAIRPVSVRTEALWTLGVAVQNNAPVQQALHDLGAVEKLVATLPLCGSPGFTSPEGYESGDFCTKVLFAISALARNSEVMQVQFDTLGLFDWLVDVGIEHPSISVAKKAMALLDTALAQNSHLNFLAGLPLRADSISHSLLARVHGTGDELDIDTSEKAMQLVLRLLEVMPTLFGTVFRQRLSSALHEAATRCEKSHDAELCEGFRNHADAMHLLHPSELADL
mmetsp:Transcript_56625/g.127326  ORF Transcript_56625/g.127326 Transcript_56625/m.127326 type:complete len:372 (+) Transcript_56625:27-1142(+)